MITLRVKLGKTEVRLHEAQQLWRRTIVGQLFWRDAFVHQHRIEYFSAQPGSLMAFYHVEVQDTQGRDLMQAVGVAFGHEEPFWPNLEKPENAAAA